MNYQAQFNWKRPNMKTSLQYLKTQERTCPAIGLGQDTFWFMLRTGQYFWSSFCTCKWINHIFYLGHHTLVFREWTANVLMFRKLYNGIQNVKCIWSKCWRPSAGVDQLQCNHDNVMMWKDWTMPSKVPNNSDLRWHSDIQKVWRMSFSGPIWYSIV
jgi:hypothetical protein